MKNSLFISGLLFLVYLGLVSFQGRPDQYMVNFRTPGMTPLDGRSADLIDQVNRFQLDGVSPDQNVVAGLYEVATLSELRYHDSTDIEITTRENALGIQIPMNPKTIISLGQKTAWLGEDIVLSNEDPILRRYLARHQQTLDQIATIVDRQHYANYYYPNEPHFVGVHLPLPLTAREYARILNLRARVALGEDRISDAITDASSIYRLGGHMASSGATVVEALVGSSLIIVYMDTWSEILSHPDLTLDDLERISILVNSVPPITGAKGLDIGDRLAAHQLASYLEKYGSAGIQRIEPSARADVQRSDPLLAFADWQEIHQRIDQKVNEALDVLSASDEQERRTKIREMFARPENKFSFRKDFSLFNVPALATDFTWKIIDDLWLHITPYNLRGMELARDQQEVLRVCIALKRFHFEKQRYPESLDELLGKYLDHIPLDYWTGKPIRYLRLKAGALVYTVGYNQVDEGGWPDDAEGDDADEVFLLGHDDRSPPAGYRLPRPTIPGRKMMESNLEDQWSGKYLSLAGDNVSREDFAAICGIDTLKWLDLGAAELPKQWYEEIPRLQNLRTLSLTGIELTRETLEHVAKLPALRTLVLNGTDVTGILQPIEGITQLQTLHLSRSSVKDSDLAVLASLTSLGTLTLNETDITDAAAPLIAQLSDVRSLDLSGTQITDTGIAEIAALGALLDLRLDFTDVTNAGIASLRAETLHHLSLNGTSVDNGVVESLAGFPDLSAVSVYDTQFDREGYEQFQEKVGYPATLGYSEESRERDSPDPFREIQNVQWGKLSGRKSGYKVLRDDTQLQVKLFTSPDEASMRRYSEEETFYLLGEDGRQVTVLRPVEGDFDVRVKVIPDWEQHDWIMTRETIGSSEYRGGPDLSAGLLIQESPGHLFRWSWNSVDSPNLGGHNLGGYSRITPEYLNFSNGFSEQDLGIAGMEGSDEDGASMLGDDDIMLFNTFSPHGPVFGSYKYFDSKFVWLRLQRRGNMVTSLLSTDGETWKVTSKMRVRFGNEVQVGVWCKRLASSAYVFTFEDFQVSQ